MVLKHDCRLRDMFGEFTGQPVEHLLFDSTANLSGHMGVDADQSPATDRLRETDATITATGLAREHLAQQAPVIMVARQHVTTVQPLLQQLLGHLVCLPPLVVGEITGDHDPIEFPSRPANRFEHLAQRIARRHLAQQHIGFREKVQVRELQQERGHRSDPNRFPETTSAESPSETRS